jgi:hypothetical protein
MLHRASWHYKIDWVYWIENNKDFIEQVKSKSFEIIIDDDIRIPFYESLQNLKYFIK